MPDKIVSVAFDKDDNMILVTAAGRVYYDSGKEWQEIAIYPEGSDPNEEQLKDLGSM